MDVFADLAPVADNYAVLPVGEAFNWSSVASVIEPGEWYMVAFRSIVRPDADQERLRQYDDFAHEEASGAKGFVHYYKGPQAPDRSCLSFCLWNSRAEAREAAGRPAHQKAVTLIADTYEAYSLEFLRVRKPAGATNLEFEPYDAAPEVEPVSSPRPASLGLSPAPS